MGNQYENEEFRNAARKAGVRGKNWENIEALDLCSEDFHNVFSRPERSAMSFHEMEAWAQGWWQQNGHKF